MATSPRDSKIPKFKRCKISRPQLLVLMQYFEDDPLPSFDKRQALAGQLGMSPRSVQIWFQNRRQRLLKPLRQAERQDGNGDRSPSSSGTASTAALSGCDASSDSGDGGSSETMRCDSNSSEGGEAGEHPYPVMAAQLANIFAPLLRADANGSNVAAAGAVQAALARLGAITGTERDGTARLPLDGQGLPGAAAALLAQALGHHMQGGSATISQALAAVGANGDLHSPGAAALLAHALQQQPQLVSTNGSLRPSPLVAPPPAASQRSSSTEGVDGLLLLSACADVQRRASPSATPPPNAATAAAAPSSSKAPSPVPNNKASSTHMQKDQQPKEASVQTSSAETVPEVPETPTAITKEELAEDSQMSQAEECESMPSDALSADSKPETAATQEDPVGVPSQVPPLVPISEAVSSSKAPAHPSEPARLEPSCNVPQSPQSPIAQQATVVAA